MNLYAVAAIYRMEMARTQRTWLQSIVSPVISTSLYFVVFGAAIGSRISTIEGVSYGAFIVPGLMMLMLLDPERRAMPPSASTSRASPARSTRFCRRRRRRSRSSSAMWARRRPNRSCSGLIILGTSALFVPMRIAHPGWMLAFLILTSVSFSLFGFILGVWADGFDKLQVAPLLIITPLTFLGGTFYSTSVLPPFWRTVSLFNPIVYLISGFRWSFFELADVNIEISIAAIVLFLAVCMAVVWWIFKTGYRLKT